MAPNRPLCIEPGCPNPAELAYNGKSYKKRCDRCQHRFDLNSNARQDAKAKYRRKLKAEAEANGFPKR